MNNVLELLLGEGQDLSKFLQEIEKFQKDPNEVEKHRKEYEEIDRKIRPTQIDKMISDKQVKRNKKTVLVKSSRVPVNYQKKISVTSTAFEFGKPVKLEPLEENELSDLTLDIWDRARIDSKLQELVLNKKRETESCMIFRLTPVNESGSRELKVIVLSSKNGKMIPYFDEHGDMQLFTWKFSKKENEKTISYHWVYTDEKIIVIRGSENGYLIESEDEHGFNKIPVVYSEQSKVEWEDVKIAIDRYEHSLSRLTNTNDYFGAPILFIQGKLLSMPEKSDDGKTIFSEIEVTQDGKAVSGDAKFLQYTDAPESVKLELDTLKEIIHSVSSTPDVSFSNLQGIGNVASSSMELMFIEATIKAAMNEGENRTIVQRCISIIQSAITTSIRTALSGDSRFKITFESILPNDLSELVKTLAEGKDKGIISTETAVGRLGLAEDIKEEVSLIKESNDGNQSEIQNRRSGLSAI